MSVTYTVIIEHDPHDVDTPYHAVIRDDNETLLAIKTGGTELDALAEAQLWIKREPTRKDPSRYLIDEAGSVIGRDGAVTV